MKKTPKRLARLLNLYPPYIGAGVKIDYISDDWRRARVSMKVRWYNRNYVGTHFGGSLYSMVDPQIMLMLMNLLGKDYWVWDKAACIEFVKATARAVVADIEITDGQLDEIKRETEDGEKHFAEFVINILDQQGELIAKVDKTIYVRKKKKDR